MAKVLKQTAEEKVYISKEDTPLLEDINICIPTTELHSLDEALDRVGVGVFHVILVLVAGWALASDSVEVQCISFVTPQIDRNDSDPSHKPPGHDLALNKGQEGVLDAMIFVGMMIGGYVWGSWSDVIGRRSCLITSLSVNGVFGLASAFSPSYAWFLVFRFFSGVGVGGSLPVAFSYFSEFFSRKNRGPFVIILAAFWILGSIFAALLAWIVIGNFNDSIHGQLGSLTIQSWRVYIIICTFPCISAAIMLVFLPESPCFLFSKGKVKKTVIALRRVQQINKWCTCGRVKGSISGEELEEVIENLKSKAPKPQKNRNLLSKIAELFRSTVNLFKPPQLRANIVMLIIWTAFSYGYYGLLLWFPEYFKYIDNCNYQRDHNCSLTPKHPDHACSSSHVPCLRNTTLNTDRIYLDSLYIALAAIPGTVLGIFTVNVIGARSMLIFSLIISGLSTLLIWIIPDSAKSEQVIVILSSVFGGVSILGWNALDVISTSELFPVHLRSTALGVQSVMGRLGAIAGNISFGKLFESGATPYLPILLVAAVLIIAGVTTLFLPNPRGEKSRRKCSRLRWRVSWARCCRFTRNTEILN